MTLALEPPATKAVDWSDVPVTAEHAALLESAAIAPAVARSAGVYSATTLADLPEWAQSWGLQALPAIVFPYRGPTGELVEQVKPDRPIQYKDEPRPRKYLFKPDGGSVLNVLRDAPDAQLVLIVEGTKQGLSAASYAPDGVAVYGVAGCRNWSTDGAPIRDLEVVEGKDVVVILDADVSTNLSVWEAGNQLALALDLEGAESVKFTKMVAGAKAGLDDVLAGRRPERRASYLARMVSKAGKLPGKPRGRGANADPDDSSANNLSPDSFFNQDGLLVENLCEAIRDQSPAALTEEQRVAIYSDGVYNIDKTAIIAAVGRMLRNRNRPAHRAAVEEHMIAQLVNAGLYLPTYSSEALLNTPNGMLDLATLTLKPHDPSYFSAQQIPVEWDPEAECPTYLEWAEKCGVLDQLDDLEEAVSTMLDPSRTPTKAVFLFGPSRSGKSTFLRLMQHTVGSRNYSAVTLHQLAQNRFAAANVFGKMLNCAADLSSAHVEDISIFKMMAGDDPIQADRKYGSQFAFINRALFAFSANELPTVGESSRAYVERIKPFEFPVSFAGREDPTMEERMVVGELPGILVRWVKAWQRKQDRGGQYLPTDPRVLREFEIRSDRVRQWVEAQCDIWTTDADGAEVRQGSTVDATRASTRTELAQGFNTWAEANSTAKMGMGKIVDRLLTIPGVFEVRRAPKGVRAVNVTVRKDKDQVWHPEPHEVGSSAIPSADPGGPSAIPSAEIAEDPGVGRVPPSQAEASSAIPSAVSAVLLDKPSTTARRAIPEVTEGKGLCVFRADKGCSETAETADGVLSVGVPSVSPIAHLLHLAPEPPVLPCKACGRPKELVPPGRFWFGCRHCYPATFARD